jgi:hypothetical protein
LTVVLRNAWIDVFDSTPYPGALWSNEAHPTTAGYENFASYVAAGMPDDPGTGTVVILGDSWGADKTHINAAIEARFGTASTIINSAVGGNTVGQMLARWDAEVAVHDPHTVIHQSALMNDSSFVGNGTRTVAQVEADMEAIVAKAQAIGAHLVIPGAAPYSLQQTASEKVYHSTRYAVWGI